MIPPPIPEADGVKTRAYRKAIFVYKTGESGPEQIAAGSVYRQLRYRKLHFSGNGNGFIDPFVLETRPGLAQFLFWKLTNHNQLRNLYVQEKVVPVHVDWPQIYHHWGLSITFLKHAALLIKDQGRHLLVDPVFGGLFPFIRDFTPFDFELERIPEPDHILITHGHYDHLDTKTLSRFKSDTHIIAPLGYHRIFNKLNLFNQTHLDWFDTYESGNLQITLLPCHHWTMRNPLAGPNTGLWGSYLIRTATGPCIYLSGDTAYYEGFKEIGKAHDIDLAVFNLSAYEPRWFMAESHMNPEETVRAFEELNAKKFMIVHWGTFRLGDEPVFLPPIELNAVLERNGLKDRWIDIPHGGTIDIEDVL